MHKTGQVMLTVLKKLNSLSVISCLHQNIDDNGIMPNDISNWTPLDFGMEDHVTMHLAQKLILLNSLQT